WRSSSPGCTSPTSRGWPPGRSPATSSIASCAGGKSSKSGRPRRRKRGGRRVGKREQPAGPSMNTPSHVGKQLSGMTGAPRTAGATRVFPRRQVWAWPILAAVVLAAVGWWVHRSVEQAMREKLAGDLTTILNADVEALRVWTKDQQAIAQSLARLPALRG